MRNGRDYYGVCKMTLDKDFEVKVAVSSIISGVELSD